MSQLDFSLYWDHFLNIYFYVFLYFTYLSFSVPYILCGYYFRKFFYKYLNYNQFFFYFFYFLQLIFLRCYLSYKQNQFNCFFNIKVNLALKD